MDKQNTNDPSFDLDDFKKWMSKQKPFTMKKISAFNEADLVGQHVESKLGLKKLLSKIVPDIGDLYEITKDFYRNGGKVTAVDDQNLIIEVNAGNFAIPKFFVR